MQTKLTSETGNMDEHTEIIKNGRKPKQYKKFIKDGNFQ
jgi:hypothetical protein